MLAAQLDAVARRRKREHLDRHWLAYHAGLYSLNLDPRPKWAEIVFDITGVAPEPPKPMSAERIKAVRAQWRLQRAWKAAEDAVAAGEPVSPAEHPDPTAASGSGAPSAPAERPDPTAASGSGSPSDPAERPDQKGA